jgi:UDP-N-acetyl-2-amino-2-deoxyglucuronate dehydrogenase
LSINEDLLPEEIKIKGQRTYRSTTIEGEELEFSGGFADLHTKVYQGVMDGDGYGLEDAQTSIQIIHDIRTAELQPLRGDYHPFCKLPQSAHPFEVFMGKDKKLSFN